MGTIGDNGGHGGGEVRRGQLWDQDVAPPNPPQSHLVAGEVTQALRVQGDPAALVQVVPAEPAPWGTQWHPLTPWTH